MEKEVGTEVKLHLSSDPLDDTALSEAEDTCKERDPEDKKSEKKDPPWGYCKVWILNSELQLVKNPLQDLWADQQKSIRQNYKEETDRDGVSIPKDILLETE